MNKQIKYLIVTILLLGGLAYSPKLYKFMQTALNQTPNNDSIVINSGIINNFPIQSGTNNVIISGNTFPNKPTSDYEKYQTLSKITYKPQQQPNTIPQGYSYNDRSTLLVQYMSANTSNFKLNSKIHTGYLYIKTAFVPTNGIFVYWHNSKVSGVLVDEKSLYTGGSNEFLFRLDHIPLIDYYSKNLRYYNFQKDILYNGQANYIGGFIKSFDGNYIKEITIAWE